jgi:hypothetical protein
MTEKIRFSTVDEIIDDLLETLPLDFQEEIKKMSCDDFCIKQHLALGMWIRSKYFFQNPAQEQLVKSLSVPKDCMFLDGDELSHIILEKLYQRITKK